MPVPGRTRPRRGLRTRGNSDWGDAPGHRGHQLSGERIQLQDAALSVGRHPERASGGRLGPWVCRGVERDCQRVRGRIETLNAVRHGDPDAGRRQPTRLHLDRFTQCVGDLDGRERRARIEGDRCGDSFRRGRRRRRWLLSSAGLALSRTCDQAKEEWREGEPSASAGYDSLPESKLGLMLPLAARSPNGVERRWLQMSLERNQIAWPSDCAVRPHRAAAPSVVHV